MASNAELVDYIWPISTAYVFGGSRYDPYNTDCSGMVCAAFWHIHGVDPYTLGDWTGAQWGNGTLTHIWWGTTPYLPYDNMEKGDVIFTSTSSPDFTTGNGSHVGFYTGDPNAPFLSHFANGGPYVTAVNGVYGGNETYYGVARYTPGSEDDMTTPDEVWQYYWINEKGSNTAPGGNMYNCLVDVHRLLGSHKSAAGDGTVGDMSERLDYVDMRVRKMAGDVDGIKKAVEKMQVGGGSVDYDKLADAVADKLAARMKD